jgi:hypothetical protein
MSNARPLSLRIAGCFAWACLLNLPQLSAQDVSPELSSSFESAGHSEFGPHYAQRITTDYIPRHARSHAEAGPAPFDSTSFGHLHREEYLDESGVMEGEHYVDGAPHDCACDGAGCEACFDDGCGLGGKLGCMLARTEFYQGVASFSGPVNRGGTGSFGVEGGANLGAPLLGSVYGLGWQAGVGGTLANLNGSNFTHDERRQFFATAGFFRRVDWGLQGGLVVDYLHEDWYANANLAQLRGEVSWVLPEGNDFGFWFTSGNGDDSVTATLQEGTALPTTSSEHWEVNNLYALFARRSFGNNAHGRVFAGWTSGSDGLLGGDFSIPFSDNWALRSAVTYVLPQEGELAGGHEQESWNLGIQLVYFPYCGATDGHDYYRPLFNVANNGVLMVERQ